LIGRIDLRNTTSPFADSGGIYWRLMGWLVRLALSTLNAPLRSWRDAYAILIRLRVDILRCGGVVLIPSGTSTTSKELQTSFDVGVGRVQFCRTGVGIKSIGGLVVARLVLGGISTFMCNERQQTYQCAKVVPDLRDVGVEPNGTGISIECVPVLVDLVVQDTDGAPECGIAAVTVDCLLVGFVRLWELLLCHVTAAKQIPALGILVVYGYVR
jgi:hypothetical protein